MIMWNADNWCTIKANWLERQNGLTLCLNLLRIKQPWATLWTCWHSKEFLQLRSALAFPMSLSNQPSQSSSSRCMVGSNGLGQLGTDVGGYPCHLLWLSSEDSSYFGSYVCVCVLCGIPAIQFSLHVWLLFGSLSILECWVQCRRWLWFPKSSWAVVQWRSSPLAVRCVCSCHLTGTAQNGHRSWSEPTVVQPCCSCGCRVSGCWERQWLRWFLRHQT